MSTPEIVVCTGPPRPLFIVVCILLVEFPILSCTPFVNAQRSSPGGGEERIILATRQSCYYTPLNGTSYKFDVTNRCKSNLVDVIPNTYPIDIRYSPRRFRPDGRVKQILVICNQIARTPMRFYRTSNGERVMLQKYRGTRGRSGRKLHVRKFTTFTLHRTSASRRK